MVQWWGVSFDLETAVGVKSPPWVLEEVQLEVSVLFTQPRLKPSLQHFIFCSTLSSAAPYLLQHPIILICTCVSLFRSCLHRVEHMWQLQLYSILNLKISSCMYEYRSHKSPYFLPFHMAAVYSIFFHILCIDLEFF